MSKQQQEIPLNQALDIIKKKDAIFSIEFFTYDERNPAKGSRLIKIAKCQEAGQRYNTKVLGRVGLLAVNSNKHTSTNLWLIHKVNGKEVML